MGPPTNTCRVAASVVGPVTAILARFGKTITRGQRLLDVVCDLHVAATNVRVTDAAQNAASVQVLVGG
jgi:1,4-dihydroxy-2-naphthoyl-CoA synthase